MYSVVRKLLVFLLICCPFFTYSATISGVIEEDLDDSLFVRIYLKANANVVDTLTVGEDGAYSFKELEPGEYQLELEFDRKTFLSRDLLLTHEGHDLQHDVWLNKALKEKKRDFKVLSGTVQDLMGNRYPNSTLKIDVYNSSFTIKTDENGDYSFRSISDSDYYLITLMYKGLHPANPSVEINAKLKFFFDGITESATRDIIMPIAESAAYAMHEQQKSEANYKIIASYLTTGEFGPDTLENELEISDTDGNEKVWLPIDVPFKGVATAKFNQSAITFPLLQNFNAIASDPSQETVFNLSSEGIQIDLSNIYDLDGKIRSDVCFIAKKNTREPSIDFVHCSPQEPFRIPFGDYALFAEVKDEETKEHQTSAAKIIINPIVIVNSESSVNKVFHFKPDFDLPLFTLEGVLLNSLGEALQGAKINTLLAEDMGITTDSGSRTYVEIAEHDSAVTNIDGTFSFVVVTERSKLVVEDSQLLTTPYTELGVVSHTLNREPVTFSTDKYFDPADKSDFVLSGKVTNLDGAIINAKVTAKNHGAEYSVLTDKGLYSLNLPEAGLYNVIVENIDKVTSHNYCREKGVFQEKIFVAVDGFTTEDFIFPFITLSGRVINQNGIPLKGLDVSSRGSRNTSFEVNYKVNSCATADRAGEFKLTYLPDATQLLYVQSNAISDVFRQKSYGNDYTLDIFVLTENIPLFIDNDNDYIADSIERFVGQNLIPEDDYDNDGLSNIEEVYLGTSLLDSDTDNDGVEDDKDYEPSIANYALTDNSIIDHDNDDFPSFLEVYLGTSPYDDSDFPIDLENLPDSISYSLRKCIEREKVGRSLERYAVEVTYLDCTDSNITSLNGLEHFKNLSFLYLANNHISNITPLANLDRLAFLYLNDNRIRYPQRIGNPFSLTVLELENNLLTNIDFVEKIDSLKVLTADNNQITNLYALANKTDLTVSFGGNTELVCLDDSYSDRRYSFADLPANCLFPSDLVYDDVLETIDFEKSSINEIGITFEGEPWSISSEGLSASNGITTPILNSSGSTSFTFSRYTRSGLIKFWLSMSSEECCSRLKFYIDGRLAYEFTDDNIWKEHAFKISSGFHTFRWEKSVFKDRKGASTAITIDDITYPKLDDQILFTVTPATLEQENLVGLNSNEPYNTYSKLSLFEVGLENSSFEMEWQTTVIQPSFSVFEDQNNNGIQEVGLFGLRTDSGAENKPQLFVKDQLTGQRINVFNWPANWQDVKLKVLPDLNGDGVAEVAIQGRFKDGQRPQLVIKNGRDATNLRTYKFPDLWDNPEYMAFSDVTGDGVSEIALFGLIKRNGKPQIRLIDGSDESNKLKSYTFPNNWDDVSWNRLSDVNNDGQDDWGLFGKRKDDGRVQLIVKDARNTKGALRIYAWNSGFESPEFYLIPDMNEDGINEVAVGGYRSDIDRYQLTVKDGLNRNIVLANYGWPNNWEGGVVHILGDMNNDGLSEIGLLGKSKLDGIYQVIIKNGEPTKGEFDRWNLNFESKPSLKSLFAKDGVKTLNIIAIDKNEMQFEEYNNKKLCQLDEEGQNCIVP